MNQFQMDNIALIEKVAENKRLNKTIDNLNATLQKAMKENKELKKDIKKIQEESKGKEQDMKKKFMELHTEQKKVNTELDKYEAIPEFKGILNIYSELCQFRNEIDNIFKNDKTHQEKRKLDRRVEELKQKNQELESQLKKKGKQHFAKVRGNELQQAESELRKMKEQSQIRYMTGKGKIQKITSRMKTSTIKLTGTISNALAEVQKHLEVYRLDIENIKKAAGEFPEKPTYEKIMNILLEQQNSLMKEMLNATHLNDTASNSTPFLDGDSLYDSGSDVDEADVESVHGDTKRYKIIMHNVTEQWADGLGDLQKVKAIFKTFTTVPTEDLEMERMGKITPGKKRPIRISLPTFQHVQVILRNKHRLKGTHYGEIRICSYKSRLGNRPGRGSSNKV